MTLLINNTENIITLSDGDYGYQDILFTTPKVVSDITGLANDATQYEFTYIFDTMGLWNSSSFAGSSVQTFTDLLSSLNANFSSNSIPAQAIMFNGALRIVGPTRGTQGRVRFDDIAFVDKLFSDLTDFDSFNTPVDGTPLAAYQAWGLTVAHDKADTAIGSGTYTADITINGTLNNVVVILPGSSTYDDLAATISAQLANGWCEFYRDRFIIHSNIPGTGTSVSISDTDLFSSVTDANGSPDTAVPGSDAVPEHSSYVQGPSSEAYGNATDIEIIAGSSEQTPGGIFINAGNGGNDAGSIGIYAGSSNVGTAGNGGLVELGAGAGGDTSAVTDDSLGGDFEIFAGSAQSGDNNGGYVGIYGGDGSGTESGGNIILSPGAGTDDGSVILGRGETSTTRTGDFLYVPTAAGAPTGTPVANAGYAPIVVDDTGDNIRYYSGGEWKGTIRASSTYNFPSINSNTSADHTFTVTGAVVGDVVSIGIPVLTGTGTVGDVIFNGFVSSTNNVTLRAFNPTGGSVDLDSLTYNVIVTKF